MVRNQAGSEQKDKWQMPNHTTVVYINYNQINNLFVLSGFGWYGSSRDYTYLTSPGLSLETGIVYFL